MPKVVGKAEATEQLAKETIGLKRAHQLDGAALRELAARIAKAAAQGKPR